MKRKAILNYLNSTQDHIETFHEFGMKREAEAERNIRDSLKYKLTNADEDKDTDE